MVYCSLYRMIVYILFYQDPVTREDNWFYPFKRQLIKFFLSASALIFMVRIFVICLSVILVNGHLLRGINTAIYFHFCLHYQWESTFKERIVQSGEDSFIKE